MEIRSEGNQKSGFDVECKTSQTEPRHVNLESSFLALKICDCSGIFQPLRESSIGLELSRLHRISLGVITADESGISFEIWSANWWRLIFSICVTHLSFHLVNLIRLHTIRNENIQHVIDRKEKRIWNLNDGLECSVIGDSI